MYFNCTLCGLIYRNGVEIKKTSRVPHYKKIIAKAKDQKTRPKVLDNHVCVHERDILLHQTDKYIVQAFLPNGGGGMSSPAFTARSSWCS